MRCWCQWARTPLVGEEVSKKWFGRLGCPSWTDVVARLLHERSQTPVSTKHTEACDQEEDCSGQGYLALHHLHAHVQAMEECPVLEPTSTGKGQLPRCLPALLDGYQSTNQLTS